MERPDGFHINLQADPLKRQAASVFRSNSEGEEPAVVDVALGPAFDHGKIEVHEHKTRIKVLLPKKAASRLQLHRVHGD